MNELDNMKQMMLLIESAEQLDEIDFKKAAATAMAVGALAGGVNADPYNYDDKAFNDDFRDFENSQEYRAYQSKSVELMSKMLWPNIEQVHNQLGVDSEIEYHNIANDKYSKAFNDVNKDYETHNLHFKTELNGKRIVYRGDIAVDSNTGVVKDIRVAISFAGQGFVDVENDFAYKNKYIGKKIPNWPTQVTYNPK